MTRPVLALDLATVTGWAFLDHRGALQSGAVRLRARTGAQRLRELQAWLLPRLRPLAWGVGDVAYERPVAGRGRNATRVAHHLEAVLLLETACMGVDEPTPYMGSTLKKHATGNGRASKEEVMEAMTERWGVVPADDNESDALALLSLHLERRG